MLTPDYFCARTIGLCDSPKYETIDLDDAIANIMQGKPSDANHYIDNLYKEIATQDVPRETIKVVQFSDVHLDLKYNEGSIADCDVAFCCRTESDE